MSSSPRLLSLSRRHSPLPIWLAVLVPVYGLIHVQEQVAEGAEAYAALEVTNKGSLVSMHVCASVWGCLAVQMHLDFTGITRDAEDQEQGWTGSTAGMHLDR